MIRIVYVFVSNELQEYAMTRKKRKPASFDAMVKLFIRNYDIPTRKDVDMLMAKLDRLGNARIHHRPLDIRCDIRACP